MTKLPSFIRTTAFGLLGSVGAALGAAETLNNGSFEDSLNGWQQRWVVPAEAADSVSVDSLNTFSGAHSLKRVCAGGAFAITQELPVKPNQQYSLKFNYNTIGVAEQLTMKLQLWDKDGVCLGDFGSVEMPGTANVWLEYEALADAPPDAVTARVEFIFAGKGTIWLDNVIWTEVTAATRPDFNKLYPDNTPLYEELLIPGSRPEERRYYPYWSYSMGGLAPLATALGIPYSAKLEIEEAAKYHLANFNTYLEQDSETAVRLKAPFMYYPFSGANSDAVANGAVSVRDNNTPNLNDPILIETMRQKIANQKFPAAAPDARKFGFICDEWYHIISYVPDREARANSKYWQDGETIVREKYGFGRFGIPDNESDSDPFKRIAYLRWQADISVDTYAQYAAMLREAFPGIVVMGPDEWSAPTPLDWERMAVPADILTGQLLHTERGIYQFSSLTLPRFYKDLAGDKELYMYLQFIKYPSAPSVETLYGWFDKMWSAGVDGLYAGGVEWYDRTLNHPKFSDPVKWEAFLNIISKLQQHEKVKIPTEKSLAVHYGDYTAMSHWRDTYYNGCAYFGFLAGRCRAFPTWTNDFSLDRDPAKWDPFKAVIMADATYVSEGTQVAVDRLLERGGTLMILDPSAFSYRIDGEELRSYREELTGLRISSNPSAKAQDIVVDGAALNNPDPDGTSYQLEILDPAKTKVIATFADGTPAVTEHARGNGKVWYFSFRPMGHANMDNVEWAAQWRKWLGSMDIPLDNPIWRFQLPREATSAKLQDKFRCLTGNGMMMFRNRPDTTMTLDKNTPGSYTYGIAPKASPDRVEGTVVPFGKGLLTNRREFVNVEMDPSGYLKDSNALDFNRWGVTFGENELDANTLTFDLAKKFNVNAVRIYYSGNLPAGVVEVSDDGKNYRKVDEFAAETNSNGRAIGEVQLRFADTARYIRISYGARESGELSFSEIDVWGNELQQP